MENNKKPLVSIIFPTYNVEKYLFECLESVNNQTYQDFEGIIIIDGAKDRSFEIAKEYCASHNKFKVYWQENAGSGPARNNGIEHAIGELIMFVDPDDWLSPDLLNELVKAQLTHNYDLSTSRRQKFVDNGNRVIPQLVSQYKAFDLKSVSDVRSSHKDVLQADYCSAPTRCLYKKCIIDKYNIKFPDLRRSQDIAFNCLYYSHIESFKTIEYVGYNYRVIPKDGIAGDRSKYHETFVTLYSLFEQMYDNWNMPFDHIFFSSMLFERYLYSSLRLCVKQGKDIRPMLLDNRVYNIIKFTECKSKAVRLIAFLIKKKCICGAIYMLKLISLVK